MTNLQLVEPPGWTAQSRCATLPPATSDRLFFVGDPSHVQRVSFPKAAYRVCRPCPVAAQCLAAGWGETYGMWGGMSPGDRLGVFGGDELQASA